MTKAGVHLANGPQDIARVIALGCGHHLALEMQADYLAQCPGERYIRLWNSPGDDPIDIADSIGSYLGITRHFIPWNEANIETDLSYQRIAEHFLEARRIIGGDVILHWPALSPSHGYREHVTEWLPAARLADIVDVHAYGSAAQILEICDWYHSVLPDKELLLTECNPGAGNTFDQAWWAAEYLALLAEADKRPWLRACIGFIWEWVNPDVNLPTTVNWIDQPIESAVRNAPKEKHTMSTFRIGNLDVIDLRQSLPTHPTQRYEGRALGGIEQIVIHHSASGELRAEDIAAYHVNSQGWPGIAYHFLTHQDGRIEYCQPIEVISYGVARRNNNTLHICMVGDWTSRQPPEAQLTATRSLIDNLDFALGRVYPVVGHCELAPSDYATACPGATWPQWRARLVETPATPGTDWQAECERIRAELATMTARLADANKRLGEHASIAKTAISMMEKIRG